MANDIRAMDNIHFKAVMVETPQARTYMGLVPLGEVWAYRLLANIMLS
jgi:hypothetical protein